MSDDSIKRPNTRLLSAVGILAVVVAGGIVAFGIMGREDHTRALAVWSADNALPTVALADVSRGLQGDAVSLPGTIQPYYRAEIFSRVTGYLKSWSTDIGARVKAGEVMAVIDTPDLDQQILQAKADLATAEANARLSDLTARRWKALLSSKSVAQQAVDEKVGDAQAKAALVNAAKANLGRLQALAAFTKITAPFDGIVTARKTDIGALINAGSAGKELFEVADLDKVRLYVQVPQAYSAAIQPGQAADFSVPEYPGVVFHAAVASISHAMDAASRSMLVELQADNSDGKLFAGSFCQVSFKLDQNPNVAVVPATALVATDKGSELALLGANDTVTLQPVRLGHDFGDSVEVIAGLAPSDRVIDNPPETLQNGDKVQLATKTGDVTPSSKAKGS